MGAGASADSVGLREKFAEKRGAGRTNAQIFEELVPAAPSLGRAGSMPTSYMESAAAAAECATSPPLKRERTNSDRLRLEGRSESFKVLTSAAGAQSGARRRHREQIFYKVEHHAAPELSASRRLLDQAGSSSGGTVGHQDSEKVELVHGALRHLFFAGQALFEHIHAVCACFEEKTFGAGEALMSEGEEADLMYVIAEGKVQIHVGGKVVDTAGVGESVGELALLNGGTRTATVTADTGGARTWTISFARFKALAAAADARSLSRRVANVRAAPTLRPLNARQAYWVAEDVLRPKSYSPGEVVSRAGEPLEGAFLVAEGALVVRAAEGEAATCAELRTLFFPDGAGSMVVDGEDDASLRCGAGVLVGAPLLLAAAGLEQGWPRVPALESCKTSALESCKTSSGWFGELACVCPAIVSADDAAGARGHVLGLAAFEARLGPAAAVLAQVPESPELASRPLALLGIHLEDLEIRELLGRGSYGSVSRALLTRCVASRPDGPADSAWSLESGHVVAVKQMSKAYYAKKKSRLEHLRDEKRLLSRFAHVNVLRLYGAFQDANAIYLATELLVGPELYDLIYDGFPEPAAPNSLLRDASSALLQFHIACLVEAITHVNNKGIAFRDLKPENAMIAGDGYIKLIDFGLAKEFPFFDGSGAAHFKSYTMCGTPEYLSPEIVQGRGHDTSTDLWSLGCMIFEIFVGKTPFTNTSPNDDEEEDVEALYTRIATFRSPDCPPELEKRGGEALLLVDSLLQYDSGRRLGSKHQGELHKHPYFDGFDWASLLAGTFAPEWTPPSRPEPAALHEDDYARPAPSFAGDQALFDFFD